MKVPRIMLNSRSPVWGNILLYIGIWHIRSPSPTMCSMWKLIFAFYETIWTISMFIVQPLYMWKGSRGPVPKFDNNKNTYLLLKCFHRRVWQKKLNNFLKSKHYWKARWALYTILGKYHVTGTGVGLQKKKCRNVLMKKDHYWKQQHVRQSIKLSQNSQNEI